MIITEIITKLSMSGIPIGTHIDVVWKGIVKNKKEANKVLKKYLHEKWHLKNFDIRQTDNKESAIDINDRITVMCDMNSDES